MRVQHVLNPLHRRLPPLCELFCGAGRWVLLGGGHDESSLGPGGLRRLSDIRLIFIPVGGPVRSGCERDPPVFERTRLDQPQQIFEPAAVVMLSTPVAVLSVTSATPVS